MRTQDRDVKGLGRIVRGAVSASGGILIGSGFTVVKSGTGAYIVTFATQFKAPPVCNVDSAAVNIDAYLNTQPTQQQIFVNTANSISGAAQDSSFHFYAMEADPA